MKDKKISINEIVSIFEGEMEDSAAEYHSKETERQSGTLEGAQNIAKAYRHIDEMLEGIYEKFGDIGDLMDGILKESKNHMVMEDDDWFDKVTIKKNEQELQKKGADFIKTYAEVKNSSVRLQALHEEIGLILNRYFQL